MKREKKPEIITGVFDNITNEEYHHGLYEDYIGHSGLVKLLRSPAHYMASLNDIPTPAMEFGQAAHIIMLENPEKRIAVIDMESRRKPFAELAAAKKEEGFECVVIAQEWEQLKAMREVLFNHKIAKNLILQGKSELSGFWVDDMFAGVKCKMRADYWINDSLSVIVDYKTTTDAGREKFNYTTYDFGYDIQGAWYIRGANKLFKPIHPKTYFFLIAQEKEPPYAVNVFQMSDEFIEIGEQKVNRVMTTYWNCIQNPQLFSKAYPDDKLIPLDPPAKALKEYPIKTQ